MALAVPRAGGLASVNIVYTWIRLARRMPVHVEIDSMPPGVALVAGATATVQIKRPNPASH